MTTIDQIRTKLAEEINDLGFTVHDQYEPKPTPPVAIITPANEGDWIAPDVTFAYDVTRWQIYILTGRAKPTTQSDNLDLLAQSVYVTLKNSNALDIEAVRPPGTITINGVNYYGLVILITSTDNLDLVEVPTIEETP